MTGGRALLALTDEQLRLVSEAANNLPLRWRDRFLAGIADQLTQHTPLTNAQVSLACSNIARCMMLGRGQARLADD